MPEGHYCASLTDHMTTTHAEISLRIQRAGEPIAGTLEDQSGNDRPFLGWMELISAIEDARAAPAAGTPSAEHAAEVRGGT